MTQRDADPLLEEGADDDHVFMLDDDAQYVMPQPRRYLYAPISYEQAMRPQRSKWDLMYWYELAREHRHILDMFRPSDRVKAAVSRVYAALCVLWPQNRMHQTILIVFSLWILLSYANWAVSEALPKSKKEDLMVYWDFGSRLQHDLENITLEPRPGHGTIAQRADWRFLRCYSTHRPLRFVDAVACQKHWNFTMVAFPANDSLQSTDHSYIYVNPVLKEALDWYPTKRADEDADFQARPSAKAPANVYIVSHATPEADPMQNHIFVDVIATYDKQAWPLFAHAFVAKMSHGLFSEGLEIVTDERPVADYSSPGHDPLRFDILVSVPAGHPISGLSIDMNEGDVHVLTQYAFEEAKRIRRLANGQQRSVFSWLYFQKDDDVVLSPAEFAQMQQLAAHEHFFGHLNMYTRYGGMYLAGYLCASSEIIARAVHGVVQSASNLLANDIYLWTEKGDVTLLPNATVYANSLLHMASHTGSIVSHNQTEVFGTKTTVKTHDGSIEGPALWHANFSLAMQSENGPIDAAVSVEKPQLMYVPYDDFLRTEQGRRVETQFHTHSGAVSVNYVAHTPGVPLKSSVSSDEGDVRVHLHSNFEGPWRVQGTHIAMSAPNMPAGRHFETLTSHQDEAPEWLTGRVLYDADARGPSPPTDEKTPVHLEPGKTPLDYGADSLVQSDGARASLSFV